MTPSQTRSMPRDKEMIPRILLLAVAALVLSVLALVTYATITHRPLTAVPADGPIRAEQTVQIFGANDGSVTVLNTSGALVAELSATEGGFVAGVARALSYERGIRGINPTAPVRLVQFEDGRIALFDDTTGQRIEIMGFGRDNLAAFARLITN